MGATRTVLRGVVPERAMPTVPSVFELQVNLCEWRKMLTVDKHLVVIPHCRALLMLRAGLGHNIISPCHEYACIVRCARV